jgi:hypothetical protein
LNSKTGAAYNKNTIGPGSRDVPPDTRVADLQRKLGLDPTGVYSKTDTAMIQAVKDYQTKLGLKGAAVDGKYGPDTIDAEKKLYTSSGEVTPAADASASSGVASSEVASSGVASGGSTTGKVPPQPTLNGKPSTGPKGQEWLKKYGATHNPDGTPKSAASSTVSTQPASAPQSVTQVSAANQNQAGTKATYKPDEIAAAKEAIADHNSGKQKLGARDLDFYTKIVANSSATSTPTNTGPSPEKKLTVKPVLNSKAGQTPNQQNIYTLGDGSHAYWDEKTRAYVPWDINKRKEIGKPIPVGDFKLTATKESYNPSGQAVYQEDQTLARIIQLSRF